MNEHAQEWIDAYYDGALSPRERQNAERHLAGCDACRELLEERRSLSALLQEAPPAAPLKTDREFIAEVAFQLERQPARLSLRPRLAWLAVPVALILVWSFILTVITAGSLVDLVPGLAPTLLGLLNQPASFLPAISSASPLLEWLGAFEFFDWNQLTAILAMLVVSLMYAGWLAAWWSNHHLSPDRHVFERNTNP